MRLKKIEQVMRSEPVPDVIRTLFYRSELFGKHFSISLQEVMRGPSD
jgi:hypothetical protein